jgi:hypothetical protein
MIHNKITKATKTNFVCQIFGGLWGLAVKNCIRLCVLTLNSLHLGRVRRLDAIRGQTYVGVRSAGSGRLSFSS